VVQQCSDNSDLQSIIAAAEGVAVHPPRLEDNSGAGGLLTNPSYWAGEPTACHVNTFLYHVVGQRSSNVYDDSVRCPLESASGNCFGAPIACVAGQNFFNLSVNTYLPLVFAPLPSGATRSTSNTTATVQSTTIGHCVPHTP